MDPKLEKAILELASAVQSGFGCLCSLLCIIHKVNPDPDIAVQTTVDTNKMMAELQKIYYAFDLASFNLHGQGDVFADPTVPGSTAVPAPAAGGTAPAPAVDGKAGLVGALNNLLIPAIPAIGAAVAAGR